MASASIPAHLVSQIEALGLKLALPQNELKDVARTLLEMKHGGEPTKTRAPSKPREVPCADDRCCARVWGEGSGTQCKAKRSGGDYCKMHLKKIEEAGGSQEPCLVGTEGDLMGKRIGLFWGRADQPKTGKNKAGQWVVYWNDEAIRAQIKEEQEAGTYVVADCGLRKGTDVCPGAKSTMVATKKPKTAKAPKAPKAPKAQKVEKPKKPRGRTPYFVFMAQERSTIVANIKATIGDEAALLEMGVTAEQIAKGILTKTGSVSIGAVGKVGGKKWAELGEEGQAPFKATADAEKALLLTEWEATASAATLQASAPMPPLPPAAPVPTPAAPLATTPVATPAPTLVATEDMDDVFSDDSDDEEEEDEEDEEMWNYTTPDGDAAVVIEVSGDYLVVLAEWWAKNDEADDDELVEASIGTITNVTIPDDDEDIVGTLDAKKDSM